MSLNTWGDRTLSDLLWLVTLAYIAFVLRQSSVLDFCPLR